MASGRVSKKSPTRPCHAVGPMDKDDATQIRQKEEDLNPLEVAQKRTGAVSRPADPAQYSFSKYPSNTLIRFCQSSGCSFRVAMAMDESSAFPSCGVKA